MCVCAAAAAAAAALFDRFNRILNRQYNDGVNFDIKYLRRTRVLWKPTMKAVSSRLSIFVHHIDACCFIKMI